MSAAAKLRIPSTRIRTPVCSSDKNKNNNTQSVLSLSTLCSHSQSVIIINCRDAWVLFCIVMMLLSTADSFTSSYYHYKSADIHHHHHWSTGSRRNKRHQKPLLVVQQSRQSSSSRRFLSSSGMSHFNGGGGSGRRANTSSTESSSLSRDGNDPIYSSGSGSSVMERQQQQQPAPALWNGDNTNVYRNNSPNTTAAYSNSPYTSTIPTTSTDTTLLPKTDDVHSATAPEVNHWTNIMSQGWNDTTVFSSSSQHYAASDRNLELSSSSTVKTNPQNDWKSVLTYYDLENIDIYWDRILPLINYHGTATVAKIYQALCIAYRAHRGQMRKSGEPFIIHPVEVAILLANLKMDGETVMAGLLHDTVEDTDLTFDQIEELFGSTVRSIVEGETKVSKLPKIAFTDYADEQAENLRQMFVAMTDDYRIIIVKLADRLHNMRTLRHMKPEKQIKISRETLDIFAPLAHRMGIWQFKSELEDTAFMYLYPQEYKRLNRRLRQHQKKYRETLDNSQRTLQQQLDSDLTLKQQAARVEVFGRTKELYSLWHKMETKSEHNLDNIVDVVALRVIITPPADPDEETQTDRGVWLCYHILGLVQHLPGFQPVPTRVKDYISFPKPNGYQSLHTALILNGQTIEVQIRTSMMHQVAEYGMASHWAYTDMKRRNDKNGQMELYNTPWLSSIKEWQNDMISSRDFVDSVRRELLGKRVFVFLRNGKILNLARGATAIDAAFQIHTEVGLNMHGVEINGKPVPFSYELQNGDVVSILTGEGRPSTDWMRYAKSRSTRSKLRGYFRARQKDTLKETGKNVLMDFLQRHASLIEQFCEDPNLKVPATADELRLLLRQRSQFNDIDELFTVIGRQYDRDQSVLYRVVAEIYGVTKQVLVSAEECRSVQTTGLPVVVPGETHQGDVMGGTALFQNAMDGYVLKDTNSLSEGDRQLWQGAKSDYADPEHVCHVCLPIYGDSIIGTVDPDSPDTITVVHRVGCPHAQRAVINAAAERNRKSIAAAIKDSGSSSVVSDRPRVDSVSLRLSEHRRMWNLPGAKTSPNISKFSNDSRELPVNLQWSDDDDAVLYMAEVVVHAQDRKLLLADCSEIVSETSTIVKTGSLTSDPYATLVFLVKVNNLDQLQALMDRLGQIRSVMSVERRFGSELL